MNEPVPPIDPERDAARRAQAQRARDASVVAMLCLIAQVLGAAVAGAWAGAAAGVGRDANPFGAVALVAALFAAYAATQGWALLVALVRMPRLIRGLVRAPAPAPSGLQAEMRRGERAIVASMVAVHVLVFCAGAVLGAVLLAMASGAAVGPVALRFLAAAAALSLLTRRTLAALY